MRMQSGLTIASITLANFSYHRLTIGECQLGYCGSLERLLRRCAGYFSKFGLNSVVDSRVRSWQSGPNPSTFGYFVRWPRCSAAACGI